MLEISCQNCQNYTEPAHNKNLVCAVNPDGVDNADKCRHYESINLPVVEPNVIQQAIALRWQTRFKAWKEKTQRDAESLRVEIIIDEPPAPTEWVVPKALTQHLQATLPHILHRIQKYHPKYANLTPEQVVIGIINHIETQMMIWCIDNPSKLIENNWMPMTMRDELERFVSDKKAKISNSSVIK